ncbi:MAG TPA: hypothetical protein VFC69_00900 [Dysgonamonadaceae bacterium]|nr:hypothetical protein [Dysgonamonadaceae bacterium]
MKRRRIINIIKAVVLVGVVLFIGAKWLVKYMKIDACLDQGGTWNYELQRCEHAHTFDSTRVSDYYWKSNYDTTLNREYLKRGALLDSISKSPKELIDILNMRPSESKIDFVEHTADTLTIRILNDKFLTEQMGTLGADCYMAETIYTLTEVDSIRFVKFEMNDGSHATPGLYSREDYAQMMMIRE